MLEFENTPIDTRSIGTVEIRVNLKQEHKLMIRHDVEGLEDNAVLVLSTARLSLIAYELAVINLIDF